MDLNKSKIVLDVKPNMAQIGGETTVYTEVRLISQGQPMGLLLALTYPVSLGTFAGPRL